MGVHSPAQLGLCCESVWTTGKWGDVGWVASGTEGPQPTPAGWETFGCEHVLCWGGWGLLCW